MRTIPTDRLPHLSPLVRDYFYSFGKVQEFYNGDFRDPSAFERQARSAQGRSIRREDLAAVLTEQNTSYGCGPETLSQIAKIVNDKAGAIVTGQQVGLFSGPLYTIYKALTAVKLAQDLSRRGWGSFVPVFWLASDDHDVGEIDHIVLWNKDNRLEKIRCRMPSSDAKIPAAHRLIPPEIGECFRALEDSTRDTEFKADVIKCLREVYGPGRTPVEAFARWMTRLFKAHGLILIDPADPRLKEMGKDVILRELSEDSPSTRLAIDASKRLGQAGYEGQIPLHEGIFNVFYADGERRAIQSKDGALSIKGAESLVRKDELLARARERPSLFSPNVLLRPIYQDALLPTVAYVGGQAEVAYFAQLKGAYQAFGLPMPVIYPRTSLTLVERSVAHILNKYGLEVPDLWTQPDSLISRIAQKQVPASLEKALGRARSELRENFEALKAEAVGFEPTLKNSLDLARGKIDRQWLFLEKKIRQAAAKQNQTAGRQLKKAMDNVYPNQRLQERVFNIVPFLIKYGYALMDKLDRAIEIGEHNHRILEF